jgi:hypothetical protein
MVVLLSDLGIGPFGRQLRVPGRLVYYSQSWEWRECKVPLNLKCDRFEETRRLGAGRMYWDGGLG